MFLGDFHIHSNFSDGALAIPDIVDLYGSHGFGAIAITDHLCERKTLIGRAARHLEQTLTPATFPIYLELLKSEKERAWEKYQMVVIPGLELSKNSVSNNRSAHIVALGISDYIPADGSIKQILKAIKTQNALAIAAHPVFTQKLEKQTFLLWNHRETLAQEFDAWEVASGPYLFEKVRTSGLPMIASSDFHQMSDFESWKTVFICNRDSRSILNAIRAQQLEFTYFQGKEMGNDSVYHSAHGGMGFCSNHHGSGNH
jgi:predicted metal-dependent phosphoesterase TrpH